MNEPPVGTSKLCSLAREYLERYHIDLDPRARVGMLSATQQKTVERAKALAAGINRHSILQPSGRLSFPPQTPLFMTGGNHTW